MVRSTKLYRLWQTKLRRPTFRRRVVRSSLLAANLLILAVILLFVLQNPPATINRPQAISTATNTPAVVNPADQLSSADIALTVARLNRLPETTAISNQAETQTAELNLAATNDNVIAKPQVVATALKSRADIKTYVTHRGDTLSRLAVKFGVTSESIRLSNSLVSDSLQSGLTLYIPPVNGIVYKVKSGDTPASLASHYSVSQAQIIAYNDAELGGLKVGERIIIPNATMPTAISTVASNVAWGASPIYGFNGYDFGFCTWYVATQINVPANWGNASSWAYYARLSGWKVSSTPSVGAIAQTPYAAGGEGHVAVVDGVKGNQIHIRDMNGIAGWDHVGSAWEPASAYVNFISH
ncbi:MAG TPA: LysM peptidoglycan-binding domain-containing protein [Candidatus Saccharimonadales bacterium]|nr:LysM peptidoglycan-binding domain-containing protein [Candidatus Saccharimonadales bacterium]